jgi:hypothetical protein
MLRGRLILGGIFLEGGVRLEAENAIYYTHFMICRVVGIGNLPITGLPFFGNHQTTNQTCQQNDNQSA